MYGIDLLGIYTGELTLRKAANLAVALPAGSAVWLAEGGPMAWTTEAQIGAAVEYNTHVLYWLKTKDGAAGKKAPKPLEPPKSRSQQAAEEAKARRALERRRAKAATRARLNQNST